MSEIQVSPEILHQEHFRSMNVARDLRDVLHTVHGQASRTHWTGDSYSDFHKLCLKMDAFAEGIALVVETTAAYLEEAATNYEGAERAVVKNFGGSR